MFHNVSKVVLCGRRNACASFSEDELHFSWHAQHFGELNRHFAWQARHFRRVALFSANRIVTAAQRGNKVHSTLHTSNSTLYTPHSTHHTLHFTLQPPHFTLHTLHTLIFLDNSIATASHKARTHEPGWRTAHASSIDEKGRIVNP